MKKNLLAISMRLQILVFVSLLPSTFVNGQTIKGSWESITNMPSARWYPGTTVSDGKIYVIGGNASSATASMNVVEVYDPSANSWITKTPMPVPRSQLSACTLNNKIYVIGGSSGPSTGWTPVPNVDIYDPATDTWSKGADMPGPRAELALVAVQNKIYAIGGIDGSSAGSKSVDIYDPIANTWSKGANMPTARGTMPACEIDGKIYVFGGSNGGISNWNHYATLEVYDIAANTWTTKKAMPESRSHLTGCVLNNKIFALGGTQLDKNMSYATVASYNPKTDSWESEPSMITPREAFNAVAVSGKIFAIGGTQAQNGLVAFSTSEVYDTIPKVFLSTSEIRLPAKQNSLIGKLVVPNSGNLKFNYQINEAINDGASFQVRNDSVVAAQNFGLDANKKYQFEILAISENNDSVRSTIKLSTFFKVDAWFSAPNGFLLESSDKKVMIDVLTSKSPGYGFQANSDLIYESMKNGEGPFNNIDLIYTSHSHPCHFDAQLLLSTMKNNPGAISVMSPDVKKQMEKFFTANPGIEEQIFVPQIQINSFIDTTLAGIKLRMTSILHEGIPTLSLNIMLDSIRFVHFDDYNDFSLAGYKTIGFTQLPSDVAFLGALLLNGGQDMIKQTFQTSDFITVSHIVDISSAYANFQKQAEKLKALNYQVNVPRWPMEKYSYKKFDNRIWFSTLNSAPALNRTFKDLEVEKNTTIKIPVPKTSFKDADPNDTIKYSFLISNLPLPEWAKFDSQKLNLELTPSTARTYFITITATDNHLSFSNTTFRLMATTPVSVESLGMNSEFMVYPNPVESEINIERPGDSGDNYSVDIFNLAGKRIYSCPGNQNNKKTIDLSEFSNPFMFLVITSNGKKECHKIVRY